MKGNWTIKTAREFCNFVTDGTHDSPKQTENGKHLITSKHLQEYSLDFASAYKISDEDYNKIVLRSGVEQWDILFSMIGTVGRVYQEKNSKIEYAIKNVGLYKLGGNKERSSWLKYYLQSPKAIEYIAGYSRGSTQSYIPLGALRNMPIEVPPNECLSKSVAILSALDDKIENNIKINQNLEQMAHEIYKSWFLDFEPFGGVMPSDWRTGRVSDFFDVTIGRTPPRKEPQWFTTNPSDIVWVSIADMGRSEMFIGNSAEYLTQIAISKFNIPVAKANTVLLSFKLTIGRVSIADCNLTTNEAIAHFNNKKVVAEYLYCYLKNFGYQKLGNTSSIGNAVNSQSIKSMDFVMPSDDVLLKYHQLSNSIFERIRTNVKENLRLTAIRDTLLPKLMNGEIDIPMEGN